MQQERCRAYPTFRSLILYFEVEQYLLLIIFVVMSVITHQELVNNYEVIRVLGEGSFGKVFLVRHKESKVEFAMKKYSKYHILKNGKQKGLIRSSKILQALEHKHIIKFLYYAINDEDDEIFLIFEACKKGSLEEIKDKVFRMKEISLIKQIMYQLAEGLEYLKSVAVAHRDLKPSNISFNSNGDLKIIDFDEAICFKEMEGLSKEEGFAKELMEETSTMKMYSRRSRANSFVGTELYMSPEMRHMTITDERGDIWAYGCILYELVSGRSLMTEHDQDDEIDITTSRLGDQLISYQIQSKQIEFILDLLTKILQENPDNRLLIEGIMSHEFFREFKIPNARQQYKIRLRKFLRGNYNLSDPRNILDALNMDLIGMKSSSEKFLQLTQHPVLLLYRRIPLKRSGFLQRIEQKVHAFLNLPKFKVSYLFGGSRYFKERSIIHEEDKSYIFYDEIDSIRIVEDSVIIEGSNFEKWNCEDNEDDGKFQWRYVIKSLTSDGHQLGLLHQTLQYICND